VAGGWSVFQSDHAAVGLRSLAIVIDFRFCKQSLLVVCFFPSMFGNDKMNSGFFFPALVWTDILELSCYRCCLEQTFGELLFLWLLGYVVERCGEIEWVCCRNPGVACSTLGHKCVSLLSLMLDELSFSAFQLSDPPAVSPVPPRDGNLRIVPSACVVFSQIAYQK
jgi:hypothetical protein